MAAKRYWLVWPRNRPCRTCGHTAIHGVDGCEAVQYDATYYDGYYFCCDCEAYIDWPAYRTRADSSYWAKANAQRFFRMPIAQLCAAVIP